MILSVFSGLMADSTATASFSVELKEWLVLEINSGASKMEGRGNNSAFLTTDIVSGEPVEIRALLSVAPGRTVTLRGTIFTQNPTGSDQPQIIEWIGQGDLSGRGQVRLNQETIFATWQGSGLKNGSIVFYNKDKNTGSNWKASFVLSSI
ncbi:MAG: hypothetical protein H5U06_05055 [Candidatus Aminicenantes bacterium]|nr:hypothetical protein [Candidatus Aminicenantes bacterium]